MQSTGLTDKNGKEIFEGDFLRWVNWDQEGTIEPDIYKVWWEAPSFVFQAFRNGLALEFVDPLRDSNQFEVIGNIYENPELLK